MSSELIKTILQMQAMDAFGRLVLSGKIAPYDGIVNAAEKGWIWAETCLRIVQTIKVPFPSKR